MTKLEDLKIYIVDISSDTCEKFKEEFTNISNVEIVCGDIKQFFSDNKDKIDCLVSPANAFGYMTGGYDAALSDILGWDFQQKVRKYIIDNFYGEQGVGTSFIIKTDLDNLSLIHTPTMQYPSIIKDNMVVYYCMRSTLICALQNDVKGIVIPVFGGLCGKVDGKVAAIRMKQAYEQIQYKKRPSFDF